MVVSNRDATGPAMCPFLSGFLCLYQRHKFKSQLTLGLQEAPTRRPQSSSWGLGSGIHGALTAVCVPTATCAFHPGTCHAPSFLLLRLGALAFWKGGGAILIFSPRVWITLGSPFPVRSRGRRRDTLRRQARQELSLARLFYLPFFGPRPQTEFPPGPAVWAGTSNHPHCSEESNNAERKVPRVGTSSPVLVGLSGNSGVRPAIQQ